MRTTVEFDEDAARAIVELRRERGIGVSEAVNELIRRALLPRAPGPRFEQQSRPMGLSLDVANVAEALEILDGSDAR